MFKLSSNKEPKKLVGDQPTCGLHSIEPKALLKEEHYWKKNITKKVKKHSPALKKDSRQAPQLPNDVTTFTIYK